MFGPKAHAATLTLHCPCWNVCDMEATGIQGCSRERMQAFGVNWFDLGLNPGLMLTSSGNLGDFLSLSSLSFLIC